MDDRSLIERYFSAMRRGAHAEEELIGLFAEDAIYIEPFTDTTPAIGVDQIRDRLRRGWEQPLPELELDVVSIDVSGPDATARWVCRSPALPGPIKGVDTYRIEEGRITRLEVRIQD
ncbi:MAG: nuclear transport factor 2 family protein [Acidimicrobiia bacterium]|nr:nuclear transport factor 2 family protein [Acidimicrobiia bacterium]